MRKAPSKTKSATPIPGSVDTSFASVIKAFSKDKQVGLGGRFGSISLNLNGKVFAMFVKGKFVAKLPKERVAELVATAEVEHFQLGPGRIMKEWVALEGNQKLWIGLAKEARDFVGKSARKKK